MVLIKSSHVTKCNYCYDAMVSVRSGIYHTTAHQNAEIRPYAEKQGIIALLSTFNMYDLKFLML